MALFIGRLDSKFVDPPVGILTILYSYASIQSMWGGFDDPVVQMVMTTYALFCKCVLFLFCSWLLQTDKLLQFMKRTRAVIDERG